MTARCADCVRRAGDAGDWREQRWTRQSHGNRDARSGRRWMV